MRGLRVRQLPAQALGFLPWLAALPLRERRLRARLLMVVLRSSVVSGGPRRACWRDSGGAAEVAILAQARVPALPVDLHQVAGWTMIGQYARQMAANSIEYAQALTTPSPFSPEIRQRRLIGRPELALQHGNMRGLARRRTGSPPGGNTSTGRVSLTRKGLRNVNHPLPLPVAVLGDALGRHHLPGLVLESVTDAD